MNFIDKTTLSSQCSPVTSSKVCLQWNNIEDQYDLVEATHVQYGSLRGGGSHNNDEDGDDGVLGRDAIGKRETTYCIEKLGMFIVFFYHFFIIYGLENSSLHKMGFSRKFLTSRVKNINFCRIDPLNFQFFYHIPYPGIFKNFPFIELTPPGNPRHPSNFGIPIWNSDYFYCKTWNFQLISFTEGLLILPGKTK